MSLTLHFNQTAGGEFSFDELNESLQSYLENLAERIGIGAESILEVWIADDEHYGETIRQIAPEEGHSQGFYVGVGKTIHRRNIDGSVSHYIVLRDYVAFRALAGILLGDRQIELQSKFIGEWSHFIIAHEFGHCKDRLIRNDLEVSPTSASSGFWIENYADYHISVLADEFAACVHSASEMSVDVFKKEYESTSTTIKERLTLLDNIRTGNGTVEEKVQQFMVNDLSGVFWMIFIQYSKLVGSQIGNHRLSELPLEDWDNCNLRSNSILGEFCGELEETWVIYPNWSFETFSFALPLWKAMANANEFDFRSGADSDGIFWN